MHRFLVFNRILLGIYLLVYVYFLCDNECKIYNKTEYLRVCLVGVYIGLLYIGIGIVVGVWN